MIADEHDGAEIKSQQEHQPLPLPPKKLEKIQVLSRCITIFRSVAEVFQTHPDIRRFLRVEEDLGSQENAIPRVPPRPQAESTVSWKPCQDTTVPSEHSSNHQPLCPPTTSTTEPSSKIQAEGSRMIADNSYSTDQEEGTATKAPVPSPQPAPIPGPLLSFLSPYSIETVDPSPLHQHQRISAFRPVDPRRRKIMAKSVATPESGFISDLSSGRPSGVPADFSSTACSGHGSRCSFHDYHQQPFHCSQQNVRSLPSTPENDEPLDLRMTSQHANP